jgi:3-O-methylgallate 3,4-dioxygenase
LVELRARESLKEQIRPEVWAARHAACRRALDELATVFARVNPDVVVIVGNDQNEMFSDVNVPAFAVYWGETIHNHPYSEEYLAKKRPGIAVAVQGHIPPEGADYPGQPQLARHLIVSAIGDGYDVAALKAFPPGRRTVSHAHGFVHRQILSDRLVQSVPVFVNAYYPPNQPRVERCYSFGKSLLRAIQSWDSDARVAVIASGGLSHFVVDENIDRMVMKAVQTCDVAELAKLPESYFQSGTSEIKNWIPLIGAMSELGFRGTCVDYVPCYRSEAGTGSGMGFAYWE